MFSSHIRGDQRMEFISFPFHNLGCKHRLHFMVAKLAALIKGLLGIDDLGAQHAQLCISAVVLSLFAQQLQAGNISFSSHFDFQDVIGGLSSLAVLDTGIVLGVAVDWVIEHFIFLLGKRSSSNNTIIKHNKTHISPF